MVVAVEQVNACDLFLMASVYPQVKRCIIGRCTCRLYNTNLDTVFVIRDIIVAGTLPRSSIIAHASANLIIATIIVQFYLRLGIIPRLCQHQHFIAVTVCHRDPVRINIETVSMRVRAECGERVGAVDGIGIVYQAGQTAGRARQASRRRLTQIPAICDGRREF